MTEPVEHHLRDCALTVCALTCGFVINGLGKTIDCACPVLAVRVKYKLLRWIVGACREWQIFIRLDGLLDRQRLKGVWFGERLRQRAERGRGGGGAPRLLSCVRIVFYVVFEGLFVGMARHLGQECFVLTRRQVLGTGKVVEPGL